MVTSRVTTDLIRIFARTLLGGLPKRPGSSAIAGHSYISFDHHRRARVLTAAVWGRASSLFSLRVEVNRDNTQFIPANQMLT